MFSFFKKKKLNLMRGAPLYCQNNHKKCEMKILEQISAGFGGNGTTSELKGTETWECPKCKNTWKVEFNITVDKSKDEN